MFNELMVEGFTIYAVLFCLIGYLFARQCATPVKKVIALIILFVLTFPGFLITLFFWSSIIAAFGDNPSSHP
jgi:ABC-type dipeptide/oligopeptide/nickel transport system permease component